MKVKIILLAIFFSVQLVHAEELIIRSKDAQGKEEVIVHEYTPVPEKSLRERTPKKAPKEKKVKKSKKKKDTETAQEGVRFWCCNSQAEKISVEEFLKSSGFTITNIGFDPNLATGGCMYRISYKKGEESPAPKD
jgi:hypothetical protein